MPKKYKYSTAFQQQGLRGKVSPICFPSSHIAVAALCTIQSYQYTQRPGFSYLPFSSEESLVSDCPLRTPRHRLRAMLRLPSLRGELDPERCNGNHLRFTETCGVYPAKPQRPHDIFLCAPSWHPAAMNCLHICRWRPVSVTHSALAAHGGLKAGTDRPLKTWPIWTTGPVGWICAEGKAAALLPGLA